MKFFSAQAIKRLRSLLSMLPIGFFGMLAAPNLEWERERAYDVGARAVIFCQVPNIRVQSALQIYTGGEAERETLVFALRYVPPQRFLVNG